MQRVFLGGAQSDGFDAGLRQDDVVLAEWRLIPVALRSTRAVEGAAYDEEMFASYIHF